MNKGTVKFFDAKRGFGFISRLEGPDVFVHVSGLEDKESLLNDNDLVEFEIVESPKGLQAVQVRKL